MAQFRIGKNEKWILLKALKEEAVIKAHVLSEYYGLEASKHRNLPDQIWMDGAYFAKKDTPVYEVDDQGFERYVWKDTQRKKHNQALVSYSKSRSSLLRKGLIRINRKRAGVAFGGTNNQVRDTAPNGELIFLTEAGIEVAMKIRTNFKKNITKQNRSDDRKIIE